MTPEYANDTFDFNPAEYQPAGVDILPQPGEYNVRLGILGRAKDKTTGQEVLADGRFPTLVLNRVEIVEPMEESGKFQLNFFRVGSKPYPRNASGGRKVQASSAMDLVLAIDQSLASQVEGWEQAIDIAEQELKSGATLHVKLGYEAVDRDAIDAAIAAGTPKNEAWKANTYKNKTFRRADGGYNTSVTTPTGNILPAKLVITEFVPSTARSSKPGPFTRKSA